jgi:hypothetical protein
MRELEVVGSKPSGCEACEKMCDLRSRDVWLGAHPRLKDFFPIFLARIRKFFEMDL